VTTPVKKPPQPHISRRTCEISSSLPPVHVLQGFNFGALQTRGQNCPQRYFCRPPGAAGAVHEGSLQRHLQHENIVCTVATDVSKLLNDSIADFLWQDAAGTSECDRNRATGSRVARNDCLPATPSSSITYLQTVLSFAGFEEYAYDPTSAVRWQKQMAYMLSNAEDFSACQLPWTAKYAPQTTEQLLWNTSVSMHLQQWLSRERAERTGPTECAPGLGTCHSTYYCLDMTSSLLS
jgi:hypothetical protein